jgi:hypothetical protein
VEQTICTYFEELFVFTNANLYDDGVLVFAYTVDPETSDEFTTGAHSKEFYVAKIGLA